MSKFTLHIHLQAQNKFFVDSVAWSCIHEADTYTSVQFFCFFFIFSFSTFIHLEGDDQTSWFTSYRCTHSLLQTLTCCSNHLPCWPSEHLHWSSWKWGAQRCLDRNRRGCKFRFSSGESEIGSSNFWMASLISAPSSRVCPCCLSVTKPELPREPSASDPNTGQWPGKGKLKDETLQGECVWEKGRETNRGRNVDGR